MTQHSQKQISTYSKTDIVTMALFLLSGALHQTHLEDVAMKATELFPKTFCWSKYPEQINLESVRISLKNELQSENPRVIGSIREGWMLTPNGLTWCLNNVRSDQNHLIFGQLQREILHAKKNTTFVVMNNNKGHNPTLAEVESLLRVDQYFTARNRREKIIALNNISLLDPELNQVLKKLKDSGFKELEVTK